MRKYTGIALMILFSLSAFAGNNWNPVQRKRFEDLRRPIILKLSPFHFFDRQLSLTGEFFNKSYNRSTAITLNLIYADNSKIYDAGTSFNIERRFFPRGFNTDTSNWIRNSAKGFYFGLGVQGGINEFNDREYYQNYSIYDPITNTYSNLTDNVSIKSQWIAPAVSIGYQFVLWEALYVDAFVGGGIKINDTQKSSGNSSVNFSQYYNDPSIVSRYYKGIIPRVGITLGMGL
jgi:hypothetical protein